MSEQEKKSGGSSAGASSLVMVEQSAASRHKQPYRPTDLQMDAPELHHKRSKAPAVPSVTEELKNSAENPETIERRECERAISSDKLKHNVAKKLSPNTKRRDSSPETFVMAPIEVETKKGTISPLPQPISTHVGPVSSTTIKLAEREKAEAEKKGDDDSITEEITELRTPQVAKKESEWNVEKENIDTKNRDTVKGNTGGSIDVTQSKSAKEDCQNIVCENYNTEDATSPDSTGGNSNRDNIALGSKSTNEILKCTKKEITWYDGDYLPKGQDYFQELGPRSKSWMLERKVSVGPCFGTGISFGEPSGITICVPKKSVRSVSDSKPSQSGICITVSRKGLEKSSKISGIDFVRKSGGDRVKIPPKEKMGPLKIEEVRYDNFFSNLKGKLGNVCGKIKSALHI